MNFVAHCSKEQKLVDISNQGVLLLFFIDEKNEELKASSSAPLICKIHPTIRKSTIENSGRCLITRCILKIEEQTKGPLICSQIVF